MCVYVCDYLFFPLSGVRSLKNFQLPNSKLTSRTPLFCKMSYVGLWEGLVSLHDGTKWRRTMKRGGDCLAAILHYERLSATKLRIEYRWLNILL